ncbi:NUDIX hydrolase [Limosilactobacillus pontis]|nr:NUDIX domain-containing protein [Limosilactobacillus pontis]QFV01050.1 ADP-ribose pyrophosphatase [Limosilactobacillus pontis]
MADKVVARPLITIANIIWSFNPLTHLPQVLLVKRAYPPFEGHWALPETLLRRDESADAACIRLIKDKIGVRLSNSATEQLATFTDPDRVSGERASAIAYMTFLPTMPQLRAGYGATEVGWFSLNFDHGKFILQNGDLVLSLAAGSALAFDHHQIINTAIVRIKNKLDYQPTILQILGPTFTLRQAREVYATFRQTTVDQIDNSNFKKTHQKLFKEVGTAATKRSGRPPKLFKLVLPYV